MEIQTGRERPRHRRFHKALADLCQEIGLEMEFWNATVGRRAKVFFSALRDGVRLTRLRDVGDIAILHQAFNVGCTPYIAEFDVPLGVHGYRIRRFLRNRSKAKALIERSQLRALITFSDWARRSFGLHYGPIVEQKCRTIYPLAFSGARCGEIGARDYDFVFVATSFRIKAGPEVVRSFGRARAAVGRDVRMCVVTCLDQARRYLGDLRRFPGIDWRNADLGEEEVADLLARSRCLVHPTLSDSFGVVVLEALAAGCAVIATDIASFPEMVTNANGWLLRPPTASVVGDMFITEFGNTKYHEAYLDKLSFHAFERALERRMCDFLDDWARALGMMRASRDLYRTRFSHEAWRKRTLDVLCGAFPELDVVA